MGRKQIHVVINPASGQDRPILNTINDVFRQHDVSWDMSITKSSGDAKRFAKTAVANGADVVAAYGGDGSVMEVAEGLMGTDVPLAILPGGTANLMSVELGIAKDLAKAATIACDDNSVIREVDMGEANEYKFMLRVGIGLPAEKIILADRDLKNKYGLAAYTIASFKAIGAKQKVAYQLTLDGKKVETVGVACRIDNSSNIGMPGQSLWPETDVSDGYLNVLVWRNIDISTSYSVIAGMTEHKTLDKAFHHWQAKEITIETDRPQAIQGDGELWGNTPITIKVLPAAMRVLVPG